MTGCNPVHKGYEIHLMGHNQNFISFSLLLPSFLFLRMNHLRAFPGPPPLCPEPRPCLLADCTQLCFFLVLSTHGPLSTGPFT